MPSQFPGMNPYLEQPAAWQDFHGAFITAIRAALNAVITPKYYANIEEHLYIHDFEEQTPRSFARADVAVTERPPARVVENVAIATLSHAESAAPKHVWQTHYSEERVSFIEIHDRESHNVVTVIELLSPANKSLGKDRDLFIARRHEVLKSDANYVEIDLRRSGPQLPWKGLEHCDYYLLVSRVDERPQADIWPFSVRDPFPPLQVPLGPGDPDVRIDLKKLLDTEYDKVRYDLIIYEHEPELPLTGADLAWSRAIARNQNAP
ncbi:hypothetical protein ETAA8_29290 [Anatilimnocola aggregata]|uniref:DUF4058 family protein n=1 Tax=Anatilimnocola aggregata TaxID=2528021 RepID=A0A517YC69_9BACT|nr:DUF4058 family protein [Anatilimnocola aggregata]QDU27838.1 hypothetical protein ETAA8_29290 [Anatilimnocola aggregata]